MSHEPNDKIPLGKGESRMVESRTTGLLMVVVLLLVTTFGSRLNSSGSHGEQSAEVPAATSDTRHLACCNPDPGDARGGNSRGGYR
jgi:hypothetical protein